MKQEQSVEIYSYWKQLYAKHGVPERSQIEPSCLTKVLGDTFIAELCGRTGGNYRLAGTRLCAIYGMELKGKNITAPWSSKEQKTMANIIDSVGRDAIAAVIGSSATTRAGRQLSLETLFLPLLHNGRKARRLLGITTPLTRPYWLGTDNVVSQTISSLRIINPAEEIEPFNTRFTVYKAPPTPPNPIRIPDGRRVRHLTVVEGGKSARPPEPGPLP